MCEKGGGVLLIVNKKMINNANKEQEVKITRIGGYLHKITTILDSSGKVLYRSISPLMVELRPRDIMQIIVGATILAIPLGFTEETWNLSERLPLINVFYRAVFSIIFIALFIGFNFYRFRLKGRSFEHIKRIIIVALPASRSGTIVDVIK